MSATPLRLAVIVGSNREGRFGGTVADWIVGQARQRDDLTIDVIDLAAVDLPMVYPQHPGPAVQDYIGRIDDADAFVVVTPEYNHGYPAALKQAIDLPRSEWRRKPVAFVSYGGVGGGLRAVEQLRGVFAELHAVTMRDSVSFHMAWELFDDSGTLRQPARSNAAATTMLDHLTWWAAALRTARAADDTRLRAAGPSMSAPPLPALAANGSGR
jgi:NAD(P)H-dependent FMN reductase